MLETSSETLANDYESGYNPYYNYTYYKSKSSLHNSNDTITAEQTSSSLLYYCYSSSGSITTYSDYISADYTVTDINCNNFIPEHTTQVIDVTGTYTKTKYSANENQYLGSTIHKELTSGDVTVTLDNGQTVDVSYFYFHRYQYGESGNYAIDESFGYLKIGEKYYSLKNQYDVDTSPLDNLPVNPYSVEDYCQFPH